MLILNYRSYADEKWPQIIQKLGSRMNRVKINSFKAKPKTFQVMVLGRKKAPFLLG